MATAPLLLRKLRQGQSVTTAAISSAAISAESQGVLAARIFDKNDQWTLIECRRAAVLAVSTLDIWILDPDFARQRCKWDHHR